LMNADRLDRLLFGLTSLRTWTHGPPG
jgi:hypothetical protein